MGVKNGHMKPLAAMDTSTCKVGSSAATGGRAKSRIKLTTNRGLHTMTSELGPAICGFLHPLSSASDGLSVLHAANGVTELLVGVPEVHLGGVGLQKESPGVVGLFIR